MPFRWPAAGKPIPWGRRRASGWCARGCRSWATNGDPCIDTRAPGGRDSCTPSPPGPRGPAVNGCGGNHQPSRRIPQRSSKCERRLIPQCPVRNKQQRVHAAAAPRSLHAPAAAAPTRPVWACHTAQHLSEWGRLQSHTRHAIG